MLGLSKQPTLNIFFDGDSSADDYTALFYLASCAALNSTINFLGVSIVSTGEVRKEPGIANLSQLIHHLNLPFTEIGAGEDAPISKTFTPFPTWLRDKIDNILNGKIPSKEKMSLLIIDAVEHIKNAVLACVAKKEKLTLLATGPLTNIALFIQAHPELVSGIDKVVIMGGAIDVPGNVTHLHLDSSLHQSECNIAADPVAAQIVFSKAPVTLVPLDVTDTVPFTEAFYADLAKAKSPELQILYLMLKDIVDYYEALNQRDRFFETFYLWDPLAAMLCVNPDLAEYKEITVSVDEATGQVKRDPNGVNITFAHKLFSPVYILTDLVQTIEAPRLNAQHISTLKQTLTELTVTSSVVSTDNSNNIYVPSKMSQRTTATEISKADQPPTYKTTTKLV